MEILFATSNSGKLDQLCFIAKSMGFNDLKILSAREIYGDSAGYEDTKETPEGIALEGALEVSRVIGEPVLAGDSVLYIDVLGDFLGFVQGDFSPRTVGSGY